MSPFGRRRRPAQTPEDDAVEPAAEAAESEPSGRGGPGRGPWDAAEQPELGARLDLGALRVPGRQGMQLRLEMDRDGRHGIGAQVALSGSVLQLQAWAAPRTAGIWDELRAELATSITSQGGTADEATGPFGPELAARLPGRTADGRPAQVPARFLGVDGPRWFLRAVLTGKAAVDPEAARELEDVVADVVVVRGGEARAPREVLTLHPPGRPPAPTSAPQGPEIPRRGPEITEVR